MELETRVLTSGTEDISFESLKGQLRADMRETTVVVMYKRTPMNLPDFKVVSSQGDVEGNVNLAKCEDPYYIDLIWCASTTDQPNAMEYLAHEQLRSQ